MAAASVSEYSAVLTENDVSRGRSAIRSSTSATIRTDPRRSANDVVRHLQDLIAEKRKVTSLSVTTPAFSVSLAKQD